MGFFFLSTSEANVIVHFSDERVRNPHWWLAVIAALPFLLPCNNATQTINSEHINGYIGKVVDEFERNPKDGKYLNVINPPLSGERRCDFFLPKIFMWSPQEQFPDCKITCPVHKCPLIPKKFTSETGKQDRMPRLIFDLFGNVLLVQRIYKFNIRGHPHKIVASSSDLLVYLPNHVRNMFPFLLFTRSGCTTAVLDYINSNVVRGMNFAKISESIAELNLRHLCRRGMIYNSAHQEGYAIGEPFNPLEFYTEELYSFPSSDHIMSIFMIDFDTKKEVYQNEMKKVIGSAISCDHTFRVSNNIGMVRPGNDNKFVTQFNNLFIVLNEEGKVVDWRLTKTTAFEEIRDVLQQYKLRLEKANKKLELICVDDCCKVRKMYQSIFENTPVKLDLYHACQRVCKTVSNNKHPLAASFQKEFGLIFRQDNDQGERRLRETPSPEKISQNLNCFTNRWSSLTQSPFTDETMAEIEKLKKHIVKGCLSELPPGFGTEKNERLHRLLNRSMLTGATRIGVELAVAILTVLFHYHSSCTSPSTHKCNKKVGCALPIEADMDGTVQRKSELDYSFPFSSITDVSTEKEKKVAPEPPILNGDNPENVVVVAENIEDVYTEFVSKLILEVSYDLFKVVSNLETKNYSRGLDILDLLCLANMPDVISAAKVFDKEEEDSILREYEDVLNRNLAAFGLEIETVIGDGDCAFRSLTKQINRISREDEKFKEHLKSLGLLKSEEEDTFQLRQLLADKIAEGDEELLAFLTLEDNDRDIQAKANEFRNSGVYDKMLGDLIMKTCAEVLQITIVLVTSNESVPWLLFVPDQFSSGESVFVAFHFYGAGHYDSTRKAEDGKRPSHNSKANS